jgi:hypothetical protein
LGLSHLGSIPGLFRFAKLQFHLRASVPLLVEELMDSIQPINSRKTDFEPLWESCELAEKALDRFGQALHARDLETHGHLIVAATNTMAAANRGFAAWLDDFRIALVGEIARRKFESICLLRRPRSKT